MTNLTSQSRRRFLLSAGASALTIPTLTDVFGKPIQSKSTQPGRKLGIALVGLGYYSKNLLAPALQQTTNCRLAGIVTGTPAKAEEWTKKYNIPQANVYDYKNFDRIIDNKDIDVVYVVLP
ncbi:MAG: gfo/Idh/MocA family oxidoreductase, partial [Cytophagaceae bacterium]